jgi:hypothetical membrane protein
MRLTRALLTCGAVAPPLFLAVVLVEGATRPGYSAWRNAVSQLALGDGGWVQTIDFFVLGALLLAFSVGLRRALPSGPGSAWAPRLAAGIGLCWLLLGVFPVNAGLGYPPGVPVTYGLAGAVHFLVATLLFGLLSALCFVMARRLPAGAAAWSRAVGVVVAAFYVATIAVSTVDLAGSGPAAWDGLLQRVAIFSGLIWLSLVAARLSTEDPGRAARQL